MKQIKKLFFFNTLQSYLAVGLISPFILSTLFFISFLLTFQLFRIIQLIINKDVPFETILELVMNISVSFLPITIPVSALFATLYILNKLSEDSEIIAMRSFGMSKRQILYPFMVMGLVVASILFSLNRNLIPYSRRMFKNTIVLLTSRGMLTDIKEGQFYSEIPNVMLFAQGVQEDGKVLSKVFIQTKSSDNFERVIMAKRGLLVKQLEGTTDMPSLRMHLFDGNMAKFDEGKNEIEKIHFKEYDFPIFNNDIRPGLIDRESTRTNKEILDSIKEDKAKMQNLVKEKRQDSDDFNALKSSVNKSWIEYWARLNGPFQCLIFIFLGFTMGQKRNRGKSKNTGALTLLVLSLYYVLFFVGVALVKDFKIPPWSSSFVPTILTGCVALYFYRKMDWT